MGKFQQEWEREGWEEGLRGDKKCSVALSMATAGLGGGLRDTLWLC